MWYKYIKVFLTLAQQSREKYPKSHRLHNFLHVLQYCRHIKLAASHRRHDWVNRRSFIISIVRKLWHPTIHHTVVEVRPLTKHCSSMIALCFANVFFLCLPLALLLRLLLLPILWCALTSSLRFSYFTIYINGKMKWFVCVRIWNVRLGWGSMSSDALFCSRSPSIHLLWSS